MTNGLFMSYKSNLTLISRTNKQTIYIYIYKHIHNFVSKKLEQKSSFKFALVNFNLKYKNEN